LRIVPARDGGLCRIRLMGGELRAAAAHAVADAAARYGSGVIEVTNRANLQLRGVRADAHAALIAALLDAGLGPSTPGADDTRNLMLSPVADTRTRELAASIVEHMQRDPRLHALSPKFALLLDGGERVAMLDHPHDLWLAAMDGGERFAFGLAGCPPVGANDPPAAGAVPRSEVVRFVDALLHAFLDFATEGVARMRDLLGVVPAARFLDALAVSPLRDDRVHAWRRAPADESLRFGAHFARPADRLMHAGAQPALGRIDAAALHALAELAASKGGSCLRMTPWQGVLLPAVEPADAPAVLDALRKLGLATDASDPLAHVIACAGSPGCAKGLADTKADALRLAARLAAGAPVHLSGCARSCAAAHSVHTTLLAVAPGRYDLYQHATHERAEGFGRCVAHYLTIEEAAEWLARSNADA